MAGKTKPHPRKSRKASSRQIANRKTQPRSAERVLNVYREMYRARMIDAKAIVFCKQSKCHFQISCAGHEAIQVAVANSMRHGYDWAYPYYRDMAFCAAWGMTSREFFLNILSKAGDPAGAGRQLPMHYGHRQLHIVNQSSPTGTQFLQAVGAAKAMQYVGDDQVVYVSSGEGTTAQGDYHEALNWAAREKLPVVFVIQNNHYAISVHISDQVAGESVEGISSGYENLDVVGVDGLDYFASERVAKKAVARARRGDGPTVIVADVIRLQSHSISDNQLKYRSQSELDRERRRDPLSLFSQEILRRKLATKKQIAELEAQVRAEVDADAEWAEAQADPAPEDSQLHVYEEDQTWKNMPEHRADGDEVFMVDALNRALHEELARDDLMVIYGQDVAYGKGGVFSVTTGLTKDFGEKRVFNSPLAESSIVGTAVGIATVGLKPVVEIQFGDYIWTAMMQLRNELSLLRYRSNGAYSAPAVVRVAVGGYIHGGVYHSQNIEATFAHFPGLFVIYPSNATDAKGLLKSAIRCNDPVLFLEHKGLYRQVYAKGKIGGTDDLTPLGRAKVLREGKDLTIVTWGALAHISLAAAEELETQGTSTEVIDLRTLVPLDYETIEKSIRKTSRLLVAHEDVLFMGFGAEICAAIGERAFAYLDAPPTRVGAAFAPVGHAPSLEAAVLPSVESVVRAAQGILNF